MLFLLHKKLLFDIIKAGKMMAKSKIGGQAVMEGVLMRGERSTALCVRDESGVIRTEATRIPPKKPFNKIPFIRGIINLISSLVIGTKTLMKSAEVAGEDEVNTDEGKGLKIAMVISMLLGVAIAIGLFVLLPTYLPEWINAIFNIQLGKMGKITIQEISKLLVVIGYFVLVSKNKDIRRVFMYHGAEHKTINCFENGLELNVKNIKLSSKHHDRCGTSFMVYVFVLSIIVVMAASFIFAAINFDAYFDRGWVRFLINLSLVPVVAAISYEVLMALAKSKGKVWAPLKAMGKAMQRITTLEPDEDMCEVALCAFKKVMEMDSDPTIAEEYFPQPISYEEFYQHIKSSLKKYNLDEANALWATDSLLKIDGSADKQKLKISLCWIVKADKILKEISEGKPFCYGIGTAPFFEYFFYVNSNVLIPRPETELLTEQVIKAQPKRVLDMCCGSGCIGLTVAKKTDARVVLSDINKQAIKVAKQNAKKIKAKNVKCVVSDMFAKIKGKFDIIVCNPPYIKTQVIEGLDKSVKDYEPHSALNGGQDGLDYYRILEERADSFLVSGGKLFMEIGFDQGKEVSELFGKKYTVKILKDYSGQDRIILATKK